MSRISKSKISESRKKIKDLLKKLDYSVTRNLYLDSLVKGVPGEVFRKCGKKNCACYTDLEKRHGPYKVISIYKNKKQKQISIKKADKDIWQRAVNYQKQINHIKMARDIFGQIESIALEIIELRLEDFHNE